MKILMLGWELPPHNSGGLGVACLQLSKALASAGADIEFILPYSTEHQYPHMKVTAAQDETIESVERVGIAYDSYKYVFNDGHEQWLTIFDQQHMYRRAVERIVLFGSYDVIHAHDWLTFNAALRAKAITGKPLIAHLHSIERDRAGGGLGNPLVVEIEQQTLLAADKIIAVSNHTKNMIMQDYHIPGDKITVMHNSIETSSVVPLDEHNAYVYLSHMKRHGWQVVANVGRLTIQKGLPNLLRAAQLVIQKCPKTFFLMVGNGEQYEELLLQAADLGIADRVILTGFQRGKRWRDAYSVADLFIMPSISEPFGLAPLEAVGYGTPTIISRQSGVAEVLQNCLKVDHWDVSDMANKIIAILQNASLAEALSINASKEFQRLSWGPVADSLMDLYTDQMSEAFV